MVNFGIIGCGKIGVRHISFLKNIDGTSFSWKYNNAKMYNQKLFISELKTTLIVRGKNLINL